MKERRKFEISFTMDREEKINEFMRKVDIWKEGEGVIMSAAFTTSSDLRFEEYKDLIARAFEEQGGKLYEIKELI